MVGAMKYLDIPPVWLAGALGLSWWLGQLRPFGLSLAGGIVDLLAGLLIGGGIVLMALAAYEMRRRQTTIIPHREAAVLVTSGIFKRSRNPIYLGDAMVLAGLILYWNAPLALPLVPLFVWWIERHFVIPEEDRLRRKFRAEFARYCEKTRRWV